MTYPASGMEPGGESTPPERLNLSEWSVPTEDRPKTLIPKAPNIITGVFGRNDDDKGRTYVRPSDQLVLMSTTNALERTGDTGFLKNWYFKLASTFAIDHMAEFIELREKETATATEEYSAEWDGEFNDAGDKVIIKYGEAKKLSALIKKQADKKVTEFITQGAIGLSEIKADIGSHQHHILEALVLDEEIPDVPDHILGIEVDGEIIDEHTHDDISDGLLQFFTDYPNAVVKMAEATVANPELGTAGTLDLIVWFPDGLKIDGVTYYTLLIDLKAGKWLKDQIRMQLAAYRYSTEVWLDFLGNTAPMPAVDGAAVLHLRRTYDAGYKLILVDSSIEQFERFCAKVQMLETTAEQPKQFGEVIYPPLPDGSQPLPLIEDIDTAGFSRYRSPLKKANLRRIDDLVHFTIEELQGLGGIGPKAVEPITNAMSVYGLSLVTAPTSADDTAPASAPGLEAALSSAGVN
jgi:hypothetical protein